MHGTTHAILYSTKVCHLKNLNLHPLSRVCVSPYFLFPQKKSSGRLQNLSTAIGESCLFDIQFMRVSMLHVLSRCNILTSSSNTNYTFTVRSKPTETGSTTVHFNLRGLQRDLLSVDTAEFKLVIQATQYRTRQPAP